MEEDGAVADVPTNIWRRKYTADVRAVNYSEMLRIQKSTLIFKIHVIFFQTWRVHKITNHNDRFVIKDETWRIIVKKCVWGVWDLWRCMLMQKIHQRLNWKSHHFFFGLTMFCIFGKLLSFMPKIFSIRIEHVKWRIICATSLNSWTIRTYVYVYTYCVTMFCINKPISVGNSECIYSV